MIKDLGKKNRVIIEGEYPRINLVDLKVGDVVLFYYGNKLTEWHGRNRRAEFGRSENPPYHAAMVYSVDADNIEVVILDPGATTSLQSLSKYLVQTSKRIDIIRYPLTKEQRKECMLAANNLVKKLKIYDVKGYGAFISQMPYMNWFKYIVKPSEKLFYCSDAVTYCIQDRAGYTISPRNHNFTAPVDLQVYAISNPNRCIIYTLKNIDEIVQTRKEE